MRNRAFTFVEVLVVLLILAVLIAMLLPALRRTKNSAEDIQSLSAIRQMHGAMTLYTHDHGLTYPFFGVPGNPEAGIWINGFHQSSGLPGGHQFFMQHQSLYVSALVKYLAGPMDTPSGPAFYQTHHPDRETPENLYVTGIVYSHSFIASPAFWKDGGPHEARYVQSTRVSMVRHPPRKVLFAYFNPTLYAENSVIIGFVDGSTRKEQRNMSGSITPDPLSPFKLNNRAPGLLTRNGVLGIDY